MAISCYTSRIKFYYMLHLTLYLSVCVCSDFGIFQSSVIITHRDFAYPLINSVFWARLIIDQVPQQLREMATCDVSLPVENHHQRWRPNQLSYVCKLSVIDLTSHHIIRTWTNWNWLKCACSRLRKICQVLRLQRGLRESLSKFVNIPVVNTLVACIY